MSCSALALFLHGIVIRSPLLKVTFKRYPIPSLLLGVIEKLMLAPPVARADTVSSPQSGVLSNCC